MEKNIKYIFIFNDMTLWLILFITIIILLGPVINSFENETHSEISAQISQQNEIKNNDVSNKLNKLKDKLLNIELKKDCKIINFNKKLDFYLINKTLENKTRMVREYYKICNLNRKNFFYMRKNILLYLIYNKIFLSNVK